MRRAGGSRGRSFERDLAVEIDLERDSVDGERHLRRQRLAALELAGGHRALDGALDLALRLHADHLEELADAHVEGIGVHARSPGDVYLEFELAVDIEASASLRVSSESAFTLSARISASVATVPGRLLTSITATNCAAAPAARSSLARSAMRISISLLSMKLPVFCSVAVIAGSLGSLNSTRAPLSRIAAAARRAGSGASP